MTHVSGLPLDSIFILLLFSFSVCPVGRPSLYAYHVPTVHTTNAINPPNAHRTTLYTDAIPTPTAKTPPIAKPKRDHKMNTPDHKMNASPKPSHTNTLHHFTMSPHKPPPCPNPCHTNGLAPCVHKMNPYQMCSS